VSIDSFEDYEKLLDLKGGLEKAIKLIISAKKELESKKEVAGYGKILSAVELLLKLYYRMVLDTISYNKLFMEVKGDELSIYIIRVLAKSDELNISQITKWVRALRGKASRRIIARRLEKLVKKGLVIEETRGREKVYKLNPDYVS